MKGILVLLCWFCPAVLLAQSPTVGQKQFFVAKGLALEGYDPVSYFQQKSVKGKAAFNWVDQGIRY